MDMMDKDKLILVFYIDVSGIHDADISIYMSEMANVLRFDESVLRFIIPVRAESHVECINSAVLSEEKREEVEERIDKILKEAEEAIKKLENE